MLADKTLLQMKYARIIALFSKKAGLSAKEAMAFFYNSETYRLMSNGIGDMHCLGDLYLVDELLLERSGQ